MCIRDSQQVEECALPRAVWSNDAVDLTRSHYEVHGFHCPDSSEGLAHPDNAKKWLGSLGTDLSTVFDSGHRTCRRIHTGHRGRDVGALILGIPGVTI